MNFHALLLESLRPQWAFHTRLCSLTMEFPPARLRTPLKQRAQLVLLCILRSSLSICLLLLGRGGGTKGKSMGLLWSGAKAVIKRYRRQSHTQHQERKSFATLHWLFYYFFYTFSNTSVCVGVCVFPSLLFLRLCAIHTLHSLFKWTQACRYRRSCQHTWCMPKPNISSHTPSNYTV